MPRARRYSLRGPMAALTAAFLLIPAASLAAETGWVTLPDGARLKTQIMMTSGERSQGLMYLESFPDDELMLFHYPSDGDHRLWMKHCKFPIDAAWVDSGGTVLAVEKNIPPCETKTCPLYGPSYPTRHFVEGTAGWLDRHGVQPGRVLFLSQ